MLQTNQPTPVFPLFDLADRLEAAHHLKEYNQRFVRDYSSPYGIQWPDKDWKLHYRRLADPAIRAHLEGKYWVGCRACWYPWIWILDLDHPPPFLHERIAEALGLSRSEYLLTTSPSFERDGSMYMYIRLTCNDRLPTYRLGAAVLDGALDPVCEIFPQIRRVIRLPLGRAEHIITEDYRILTGLPWPEALPFFDELEPVAIERFPRFYRQAELPLVEPPEMTKDLKSRISRYSQAEAQDLWKEGLQTLRTRNHAQFQLVMLFWQSNYTPEDARREVLKWLKTQHNGQSQTVNQGRWGKIEEELGAQIDSVYRYMVRINWLPNHPHNLSAGVTRADMEWIAQVFRGNVVNQKRLFRLVSFYRPRRHYEWVYIPYWVWQEIADWRLYQEFRAELEGGNLLNSIHSYRHIEGHPELSYSKKFQLYLPTTSEKPLMKDGRHVDNYYDALQLVCPTPREMVEFTGANKQTIYRALARENEISHLE